MSFPYLEEYRQLYEGAHRKAALPLGAPALTMHLAFWKPLATVDLSLSTRMAKQPKHFSESARSYAETQRRRKELEIDRYLSQVYERIRFKRRDICTEFSSDNEIHFKSIRAETWLVLYRKVFDVTPHLGAIAAAGKDLSIIPQLRRLDAVREARMSQTRGFEPSSQHQTINFSFKWHGVPARLRFELSTEYHTVTAYLDLSKPAGKSALRKSLSSAFRKIETRLRIEEKARAEGIFDSTACRQAYVDNKAHQELYHSVWNQFCEEILETPATRETITASPTLVGRLFADFRGLLMAESAIDKDPNRFRPPFSNKPRKGTWDHSDAPADWAAKSLRKFWSFLSCGSDVDLSNYEFTASMLLRKNAVYVSALGAQPVEPLGVKKPVLFFINLWANKKWQIGRLVDTLHQLGTLRLAAIIELGRMHRSGGWLRDIEKLIESTRDYIQKESAGMSRGEDERGKVVDKIIKRVSTNVSKMEGGLAKIFEIGNDPNLGYQSIAYRLERANYYVTQFMSGADRLEAKRIEGFQPYRQFVLRRLGSSFAYVQMLNQRLERINREIRFFVEYLAAQSSVLQGIRTNKTNEVIEGAQGIAEFALCVALVPYYLVSLWGDFFSDTQLHGGSIFAQIFTILVVGTGWYLGWKTFNHYSVFRRPRQRLFIALRKFCKSPVLIALTIVLLVACCLFLASFLGES